MENRVKELKLGWRWTGPVARTSGQPVPGPAAAAAYVLFQALQRHAPRIAGAVAQVSTLR